ncbi:MAG: Histidine kinase [Actinomycetia bacterium]|nr:Histidine kinase [Actinomycetes bacterium]
MTVDRRVGALSPAELRGLFLFEALTGDQLAWLAGHGWVAEVPAGSVVLSEGDPAAFVVLLLDGTITLSRRVGDDDVETVRTSQVGAYAGATRAYVEADTSQAYSASMRALTDARLFVLTGEDFGTAIRSWFPMAVHLLEGLFLGMNNTQQVLGQRQQLLALGALSAGLTHELNNPAAAAVRATAGLRTRVAGMRQKLAMLAHDELDPKLLELLVDVQEEAVQAVATAPRLSPIEETEREDEITDWLEERAVRGGWELAPIFTAAGITPEFLDKLCAGSPAGLLEGAIRWLAYTLETELLLDEISDSVTRISSLVAAAKQYSNMDRSPHERVDIHAGLKSTLMMLGGKLTGIEVVKDFDRTLPPVPVYPGELNQVWTNLIDNAVQAMDGHGTLTIRTSMYSGECVQVEISDTGPGIPEAVKGRIFEPFFTTKPVGQGTGLGLDISYRIVVARHGGALLAESQPGDTRFTVRLPLTEQRSRDVTPADI